MVSLVVTDLDGTLWGPDIVMPDEHRAALAELRDDGIPVLAATSRRPRTAFEFFDRNQFDLPAVCVDGAIGFEHGMVFHATPFSGDHAAEVLHIFLAHHVHPTVLVLGDDHDVVISDTPSTSEGHLAQIAQVTQNGDLYDVVRTQPVYSFNVLGVRRELIEPAWLELVARGIAHASLAPELSFGDWGLIVTAPGITKWSGVLSYCELHGLDPSQILAVGDGANDVPLLREVAFPIAVEGGDPDALAVTKHRIGTPADRGWAAVPEMVRRFAA